MKVSSSDIVALLRRFKLADDSTVPRMIEYIKTSHPSPTNTLVSFRFNRIKHFVLFDDTAADDKEFIMKQLSPGFQEIQGKLIENPNDSTLTFGLPFKGKDCYVFVVESGKTRLDAELASRYPETSRSTWQKHIKAGHVSVNNQVATSTKLDVTENDSIEIALPEKSDFSESKLPIIFIDDNVIVINKPVGVLTHSKGELNDEFTVAEFFRDFTTFNQDTNRPGIIHRLDRDTSGVMIGARNPETAAMLQKQFSDRTVKKTYFAVVEGQPKLQEAKIDLPIGRNPAKPSTFRVDAKGKSAETVYTVKSSSDKFSLLELKPRTGRTHQLRVHLAYIGSPIFGDKVYGKESDRMYLHAHALEITIPTSQRKSFQVEIPEEFSTVIGQIENEK